MIHGSVFFKIVFNIILNTKDESVFIIFYRYLKKRPRKVKMKLGNLILKTTLCQSQIR